MSPASRRDALAAVGSGVGTVLAGCLADSCRTLEPVGGDWPQPGRDPRHTGADASLAAVTEGADHWRIEYDSAFDPAGIAVRETTVVVAGRRDWLHGAMHVRSLTDGALRRAIDLPRPVVAPPVLTEDVIVVTAQSTDDGARYRAFGYDGEPRWTYELAGRAVSPPTIVESTVYGGTTNGTVFAVNATDGAVLWERAFGDDRQGGAVSAPVTLDDSRVYVPVSSSKERGIHALSRDDGETRWTIEGLRIRTTMVRTGSLLLVSYPSTELVAFDARSGERRWSRPLTEHRLSPPAASGDTVVVADGETLFGLESATGEPRWTSPYRPLPYTQPMVMGDTVVVHADSGLVGCSLANGDRIWSIDGSGAHAIPIANGLLYVPEADTLAAYTSCEGG